MSTLPRIGLGLVLMGLLGMMAVPGADAQNKAPAKKKDNDNAALAPYLKDLRSWFTTWDLNKDTALDKEELAKAFRGPKALPFDHDPKAKAAKEEDKDEDKSSKERGTSQTTANSKYNLFVDYRFLKALDKDTDDQISKDEYELWALAYAQDLKELADAQEALVEAQQKLAKAAAAQRQNLERELRERQQRLQQRQQQANRQRDYRQQMNRNNNNRR